jgi:phosphatidylinositol alpha-1,6-mannosyltransferase
MQRQLATPVVPTPVLQGRNEEMKVAFATEQRFFRDGQGTICSDTYAGSYNFWTKFRRVFGSVLVIARVSASGSTDSVPVEGPGISVHPLPDYFGLAQYVRHRRTLLHETQNACIDSDALIARVPGAIGRLAIAEFERTSRPYAVYVVGDPAEVFKRGVVNHPLRPLLRWLSVKDLRRWCKEAVAVAYVTQNYLQQRYPSSSQFTTSFSDVDLPTEAFLPASRSKPPRASIRIVSVASLSQPYKGIDSLLEAAAVLKRRKVDVHLDIVGDGRLLPMLKARAHSLGIRDCVDFTGQLSNALAVRERLDQADLFVLPSLTEGLPRALIEAMARGLPCIGSSVGGVIELLSPSDLVPPGRPEELADKVVDLCRSSERYKEASARNLQMAAQFSTAEISVRREQFCRHIKSAVTRNHTQTLS